MVETGTLVGLPGNLALWRLLVLKGLRPNLRALEETLLWDFSGENLVQELGARGFQARLVRIDIQDLDHLPLPTLAQLTNGNWIILREQVPGGCLLEQGMGGCARSGIEVLTQALSGEAIELSEALSETGGLWKRIGRLLPHHRKILGQAALITLAAQALGLAAPWLIGLVVDQSLSRGAPGLLGILCLGLLLSALFQAWVGWLRDTALLAFSSRFDATIEKGLFDHLLHLPFTYLQGKTLGELLQSFNGLRRARTLLLDRGLGSVFSGISATAFLIYMAALMPMPTVLVVGVALVASLLTVIVGYLQAREQRREVEASQKENSALVELMAGAATLKATASQTWALRRWSERLRQQLHHSLHRERFGLWFEVGYEALNQGLLATILIWGGHKVLAGDLTLGSLLVFSQLSASFMSALLSLAYAAVYFLALRPQIAAVQETFATERLPRPKRHQLAALNGPVRVEDVWFRYAPKSPWILRGSSLQVQPGEIHQIKGPSGSGKSTLLKLLAGLYTPDSGKISIGGLDPTEATADMVFLPQFPQLHGGSILENLKLFSGESSRERLMEVARDTGLDQWVSKLPMGYQTMLASGGENLSGGQRQLVALTAILASKRSILLLDEAMSNLDWMSRERILGSPHFKNRTVIYASHEEMLPKARGVSA